MKKLIKIVIALIIIIGIIKYLPMAISFVFPRNYSTKIDVCAERYGVDKNVIYSIIKAESDFNKNAVSQKDAKGLMQLTDETAAWCADKLDIQNPDLFDPATNIELGTYYYKYLLDKCGNEKNAIAAYNAGHGNVESWLGSPQYSADGKTLSSIPFNETEKYYKKVQFYKKVYTWLNKR